MTTDPMAHSVPLAMKAKAAGEGLGREQLSALEQLTGGKSVAESAQSAGVSRATVYRWMKDDPAFKAAYNAWHNEMEESCRSRLLMLTDLATVALQAALKNGDARAALQLLKGMGLIKPSAERLTDTADLKLRAEIDELKRRIGMEEEKRKVESDAKQARGMDELIEELLEKKDGRRSGG